MIRKCTIFVFGALISALAGVAMGGTAPAYVIYSGMDRTETASQVRTCPVYSGSGYPRRVEVVSRALSEQPVHPHLIELNYVHTKVYLDPEKNYERPGHLYRIDHNHTLLKAFRRWKSLNGRKARVIYGIDRKPDGEIRPAIQPRMIILKPNSRPAPQNTMPRVPAPKKRQRLMALASVAD